MHLLRTHHQDWHQHQLQAFQPQIIIKVCFFLLLVNIQNHVLFYHSAPTNDFLQILADASSSENYVISCPVCWFSSSQQLHNADLECHLLSHVLRCAFSNTYACSRFTIRPSHNTNGRFTKPRNFSRSVVFGSSSSPPYKSMHCSIILPLC
jgi:hypothetical protein